MTLGDSKTNLPWVEKYRPSTLEDLVSHEEIIKTITKFVNENQLPHLLFYGPPGTGKTSTILACARKMYTPTQFNSMVLELNASDDRGIGIVRGQILSFASTRTIFKAGYKLIILDEADAMTNDAQNALRRIIEKYTDNVRFCVICNYLSKIIPAVQSRCTRFRFAPLGPEQIMPRLDFVIEKEKPGNALAKMDPDFAHVWMKIASLLTMVKSLPTGCESQLERFCADRSSGDSHLVGNFTLVSKDAIFVQRLNVTDDGKQALLTLAGGDMRKIINVLQSTSMAYPEVNEENVYNCVGHPQKNDIANIVKWLLNEKEFSAAYLKIQELKIAKGLALEDILSEIHLFVHRIELPSPVLCNLLVKMSDIEQRLAIGANENIQLNALLSAFIIARDQVIPDAD